MQLLVGQAALAGDFEDYVRRFAALEVTTEPGSVPRPSRLERWRAAAPEEFAFSVVLPSGAGDLHTHSPTDEQLAPALDAAARLSAQWLLLRTPVQARPQQRFKERLRELVERLRVQPARIAWEPSGLWETRMAGALAQELGITLVSDLSREAATVSGTVYTRLRRHSIAPGLGQLTNLLERIALAERAIVIVEGRAAENVQRWLGEQLQFVDDSSSPPA